MIYPTNPTPCAPCGGGAQQPQQVQAQRNVTTQGTLADQPGSTPATKSDYLWRAFALLLGLGLGAGAGWYWFRGRDTGLTLPLLRPRPRDPKALPQAPVTAGEAPRGVGGTAAAPRAARTFSWPRRA